jgi:hypothetical protein
MGTDVIMDETRSRGEGEISETGAGRGSSSSLGCADLLTEFLPFDRATLENAIDRFLEPLDDLGAGWGSRSLSSPLIPATTLVIATGLAAEVARRRLRGGPRAAEEGEEGFAPLPGYAAAWGLGEP